MKPLLALAGALVACTSTPPRIEDPAHGSASEERSGPQTGTAVDSGVAGAAPSSMSDTAPNAQRPSESPSVEDETARGPFELAVPGFGAAVVVLPDRSVRPARILVGAHGAGDSPEWQCEHWGAVARGRYFVLCPRGRSLGRGGGYYFANHIELEREFVAALGAVRDAYGDMVRSEGGVYTGYSQGATMGALMILEHGATFPYLVLVEGGSSEWSLGRARRYAASGGRSVALVCGGSGCMRRAEASAKVLERAGLRARAEHVPGGGHTYVGAVGERATEVFEGWLFEGP